MPILVGRTTPEGERALAAKLSPLADGKTLFVVSSDFVHYGARFGYTPFGAAAAAARDAIFGFENRAIARLAQVDANGFRQLMTATGATVCGRDGQAVLLELLPKIAPHARAVLLSHYSSSDLRGADADSSVGYVALAFVPGTSPVARPPGTPLAAPSPPAPCEPNAPALEPALGKQLIAIARGALATALGNRDELSAKLAGLPASPALDCARGVFVTLEKSGALRGCVGQAVSPILTARGGRALGGGFRASR